ncbi:hypothetical protein [Chryseobacterium hispalense]|uniref:hypothetical protein n=1 Tax=Chryseobacterium hispalense TaxID=1453492 RepID=UPI00391DDB16
MRKIHESTSIILGVELDSNNSFDNIFGKLKFIIDGKDIATDKEDHNLSYFYVDCKYLKSVLENNDNIENILFLKKNEEILSLWREWEDYKSNFDIATEESQNVKLFDRNYFKTGNIFNSFFFDEIMIFYITENDNIKFKFWYKVEGSEIYELKTSKAELLNCIKSFIDFFDVTNNYLKNKE